MSVRTAPVTGSIATTDAVVGTPAKDRGRRVAKSSGPSREHKLLDRAAEAAIKNTCKFKPGTVDGKPETLTTFVEYDWKLN